MKILQVFSEPKRVLQAAADSQNSPAGRRKSRAFRSLLLALIAPTTAQAATESWLDVQAWRATLTHETIDHGTKQTSNTWVTRTTTWTVNQNLRIVYEFQGMSGTTNSRTWGSETNLGLTRGAPSTCDRQKSKFLSVTSLRPAGLGSARA